MMVPFRKRLGAQIVNEINEVTRDGARDAVEVAPANSFTRGSDEISSLCKHSRIDPDGAFAWISVHHIVQAIIG